MEKPKVLLIEDDEVLLRLYEIIVRGSEDFQPVAYRGNLRDVINSVNWDEISVVVCDYWLGFRNRGSDILEWVKKTHPSIRRVLLTGDGLLTIGASNAEIMLLKPVTSDALLDSLRKTNG